MEDLDIHLLVDGNLWVHSAVLERGGGCEPGRRLRLGLSAAGHRRVLSQGVDNFVAEIRSVCESACQFDFVPEIGFVTPPPGRLTSVAVGEDMAAIRSWVEEAGQHRLLLEVSDALSCFHGHFPGFPVLSGVVQLHWAARLTACLFGLGPEVSEIRQLKFHRVVIPPCWLELSLTQTRANEVRFEWSSHSEVHAQGNLVFTGLAKC